MDIPETITGIMKVYQKDDSDCLKASLCSLIGISYESIPNFHEFFNESGVFNKKYKEWISRLGLNRYTIPAKYRSDLKIVSCDMFHMHSPIRCIGTLDRTDRDWSHSVVLEIDTNWTVKMFDPSLKGSDFSIEDLKEIDIIGKFY